MGMSNLMSKRSLILFPPYLAFYPLFTTALSAKLFARFRMTKALGWIILDSPPLSYPVCNPLTNPVGSSSFRVNPQTTCGRCLVLLSELPPLFSWTIAIVSPSLHWSYSCNCRYLQPFESLFHVTWLLRKTYINIYFG